MLFVFYVAVSNTTVSSTEDEEEGGAEGGARKSVTELTSSKISAKDRWPPEYLTFRDEVAHRLGNNISYY